MYLRRVSSVALLLLCILHMQAVDLPELRLPPGSPAVDPELPVLLEQLRKRPAPIAVITRRRRGVEAVDGMLAAALHFYAGKPIEGAIKVDPMAHLRLWHRVRPIGSGDGSDEAWLLAAQQFLREAGVDRAAVVGLEVPIDGFDLRPRGHLVTGWVDAQGYQEASRSEHQVSVTAIQSAAVIGEAVVDLTGLPVDAAARKEFRQCLGRNQDALWDGCVLNFQWFHQVDRRYFLSSWLAKTAREQTGMRIPLQVHFVRAQYANTAEGQSAEQREHQFTGFVRNIGKKALQSHKWHWDLHASSMEAANVEAEWRLLLEHCKQAPRQHEVFGRLTHVAMRLGRWADLHAILQSWQAAFPQITDAHGLYTGFLPTSFPSG